MLNNKSQYGNTNKCSNILNEKTFKNIRSRNLYYDRKKNSFKQNNYSYATTTLNLNKNKKYFKNNNNFKINRLKSNTLSNIFRYEKVRTFSKRNKISLNNILYKSINQNKNKIFYQKFEQPKINLNNISKEKNNNSQINNLKKEHIYNKKSKINISRINNRKIKSERSFNIKNNKNRLYNNKYIHKSNKKARKLNLNKFYKNLNLKLVLKLQKELEKEKEKKKIQKISWKILYPNKNIDDVSILSNEIINFDDNAEMSSKSDNNSKEYDIEDIESITKKLDFDNYNKLSKGNIFLLDNNKVYNEYKDAFEQRFNKFNII